MPQARKQFELKSSPGEAKGTVPSLSIRKASWLTLLQLGEVLGLAATQYPELCQLEDCTTGQDHRVRRGVLGSSLLRICPATGQSKSSMMQCDATPVAIENSVCTVSSFGALLRPVVRLLCHGLEHRYTLDKV